MKKAVKYVIILVIFVGVAFVVTQKYQEQHRYDGYKRYQTFDEFQMKGVGEPTDTPFVYVKKGVNKISVYRSDFPDVELKYIRNDDHWESIAISDGSKLMKYDKHDVDTYYRFFFRDTILNYNPQRCATCGLFHDKYIVVQTKQGKYVEIILENDSQIQNNYQELVHCARCYRDYDNWANVKPDYLKGGYHEGKIIQRNDTTIIEYDSLYYYNRFILLYMPNSLGLFGLQPEKNCDEIISDKK